MKIPVDGGGFILCRKFCREWRKADFIVSSKQTQTSQNSSLCRLIECTPPIYTLLRLSSSSLTFYYTGVLQTETSRQVVSARLSSG